MKGWLVIAGVLAATAPVAAQAVRDFDPHRARRVCEVVVAAERQYCIDKVLQDTVLALNWYQTELSDYYSAQSARRDGDSDSRKMLNDTRQASLTAASRAVSQSAGSLCFLIAGSSHSATRHSEAFMLCQVDQYANFLGILRRAYAQR